LVFLVPPWQEIYKLDNERKQGFEETERVPAVMLFSTFIDRLAPAA
jgi:predicted ATPase